MRPAKSDLIRGAARWAEMKNALTAISQCDGTKDSILAILHSEYPKYGWEEAETYLRVMDRWGFIDGLTAIGPHVALPVNIALTEQGAAFFDQLESEVLEAAVACRA